MTAMQKLEFWATIFGLIVSFIAMGSLFFGWFPFTSTIYLSIIIFLVVIFYFFGSNKKIKFGRRQSHKHRKYIKLKWIFIIILVILFVFALNPGSWNNLTNKIKVTYLTNTNTSSNLNPECEKRLTSLIGEEINFYISTPTLTIMPAFISKSTNNQGADVINPFSSKFGQPTDSNSNIYHGKNVGEKPNWLYGGGMWSYNYDNPAVTNSQGVIIGENEIEFTIILKDISKYEDEDLAIVHQLNYQTDRHIRPKYDDFWGESSTEFILTVPTKDVLKVTKCNLVN